MSRLPVLVSILGFAAILVAGEVLTAAQAASPAATPAALPPPLDAWDAAWASGDIETILATYTEDVVFEEVPFHLVVRGQDELRAHLEAFYAAFPDITFVVTGDAFVAGDRAAVEWTASGTYTGQIPGMPPGEGQIVTFRGANILELEGDKVRVEREYYDAASLLAQLGALPAPGTPTS
jgi:steroid delta-isomerase-like uncharacterized protein